MTIPITYKNLIFIIYASQFNFHADRFNTVIGEQ